MSNIDFEKAYNHTNWGVLDLVKCQKGFGTELRRA